MLDGYKFPVYPTGFCPRNQKEWKKRSSTFNCSNESSYACLPNENFTLLLEFCYPLEIIAIQAGKLAIYYELTFIVAKLFKAIQYFFLFYMFCVFNIYVIMIKCRCLCAFTFKKMHMCIQKQSKGRRTNRFYIIYIVKLQCDFRHMFVSEKRPIGIG